MTERMKHPGWILLTLLCMILASCSEVGEENEYEDWQARNELFINAIADSASRGLGGWVARCPYTYNDSVQHKYGNSLNFIYMKQIAVGEGTEYPHYTDSVRVHYQGRLIPQKSYSEGYIFDKSYQGNVLNERTDVPALFSLRSGSTITGFSTAIQNMHVGDAYKVVIPHTLAYGTATTGGIPGYSALIFTIKLARIYRYRIDNDTSWY